MLPSDGLLYGMFRFSTRIFCRGVPGFATNCSCGVWCRGLTICLPYVGQLFSILVWNDSGFVRLTSLRTTFLCVFFRKCFTYIVMHHSMTKLFVYLVFTSQIVLYFSHSILGLSFCIDIILTLSNSYWPIMHKFPTMAIWSLIICRKHCAYIRGIVNCRQLRIRALNQSMQHYT